MALNDEELERYARHIVLREIGVEEIHRYARAENTLDHPAPAAKPHRAAFDFDLDPGGHLVEVLLHVPAVGFLALPSLPIQPLPTLIARVCQS